MMKTIIRRLRQDTRLKCAIILAPVIALLLNTLIIGKYTSISWISPELGSTSDTETFQCQPQRYTIEILSIDPLIVYINNFLAPAEINYLLKWSNERFNTAFVLNEERNFVSDTRTTSLVATLARHDVFSECLAEKMKSFLGNVQHIDTEPIRMVKYAEGDNIKLHTDWARHTRNKTWNPDMTIRPNNRLLSILAYIEGDCDDGETYFPEARGVADDADGGKFSRTDGGLGLLVKPRRGNAVFWNNLHANGSGDLRTIHAGMPVNRGTKIGINIWSHYFLDAPIIG